MVDRQVEEISPVQYACETVSSVNKELHQLLSLHASEPRRNLNPFTMRLQGVIDACVMGGVAKYQEAFITGEFIASQPANRDHVLQLRQSIVEQVRVLEAGLALHGKLAPAEVQPLHKRLVECLSQMKQRMKDWGFPSPEVITRFNSLGNVSHLQHRRAESDAGVEYNHIKHNSSFSGLASDRKAAVNQRALTIANPGSAGPPSNRSSSSGSSLYGQLTSGEAASDDEENLYCKPSEILEKLQATGCSSATPPPSVRSNSTTPNRSNGQTIPKSSRWANEYIIFTPASLRDSGFGTDRDSLVASHSSSPRSLSKHSSLSQQTLADPAQSPFQHDGFADVARTPQRPAPPPLPPRSGKSSVDEADSSTPPPVQPKRTPKRCGPLIPSQSHPGADSSDAARLHRPPPAPPLPPKAMIASCASGQPPPVPPHRSASSNFSKPLDFGSGSLVDEVCSLLAANGCQVLSNDDAERSPSPRSPQCLSEDMDCAFAEKSA